MSYRSPLRPLHWGLALLAITLVWLVGAHLFPQTRLLVLSAMFCLIFVVWLIDAIVYSVRRRIASGKR